ncbi:hypothetical protein FOA52_003456 [Chlamydomonas sp. UWO 241]|nr:hypothetical protein FOA52_003456 [Chlamydomonas sp. UWO 241]
MAHGAWSVAVPGCPPRMAAVAAHAAGPWLPPAGTPMRLLMWGLTASGGGARLLHTSVSVGEQAEGEQADGAPGSKTSRYRGVSWHKGTAAWEVYLQDPQAKCKQHVGTYTSEEDAARAYDWAAVKLHGPGYTKRNFPGELISKPPVSLGDEMRERKTSRFHGMYWNREVSAWQAQVRHPETKSMHHIGYYNSEEDAARACDHAVVELRGPDYTKRNFPNDIISEPPAARGRKRVTSRSRSL